MAQFEGPTYDAPPCAFFKDASGCCPLSEASPRHQTEAELSSVSSASSAGRSAIARCRGDGARPRCPIMTQGLDLDTVEDKIGA